MSQEENAGWKPHTKEGVTHKARSLVEAFVERFEEYARTMREEFELFLGSALGLIGLLGFESGKYCDGNTSDYLSCTRPATYYYFDAIDIICVVVGVFLVLFWVLRKEK